MLVGEAIGENAEQMPSGCDVLGIKDLEGETYPTDFLACDIPDGACEVTSATEVGAGSFALPVGDPMDT